MNKVDEALKLNKMEAFEKDLASAMAVSADGKPTIIAIFDLDKFMRVNDTFGVDFGDKVLINAGEYFKKSVPANLSLYRIGGDEFAIIFDNVMSKAEITKLMNEICSNYTEFLPNNDKLTISVGIAEAIKDASSYQELIKKAETALYSCKSEGGNKVALA